MTGTCKDKAGNISAVRPLRLQLRLHPARPDRRQGDPRRRGPPGSRGRPRGPRGSSSCAVPRGRAPRRPTSSTTVRATASPTPISATGKRYAYVVQAIDQAGNTASDSAAVTPERRRVDQAPAVARLGVEPQPPADAALAQDRAGQLLQRPALPQRQEDPQRMADQAALPAAPRVDLRAASAIGWARRPTGGCCGPGTGTAASTATASCWASARSSSAEARHNPGVRCLYVDLDGTLLGAGGAVTRDGEGRFTLLGVRALEACHRAQALVVAMSGRPRAVLGEDVRLLGLDEYVFEAGAGFVVDGEVHWLTEPDTHERIAASGAADLLLERYAGRLEPHTPVRPRPRGLPRAARARRRRRGRGAAHRARPRRPAAHGQRRGPSPLAGAGRPAAGAPLPPAPARAVQGGAGSPRTPVPAASRARTASRWATRARISRWRPWSARSGSWPTPSSSIPACAPRSRAIPMRRVAEAAHGAGVYEAVVTTLAQR